MRRKQCEKCPWKVGTDPREIPGGYCEAKHRALKGTIAAPGALLNGAPLRVMACHESHAGREQVCVGWLDQQLNEGNNVMLRLAVRNGRFPADYELDGAQHATLEDTFPTDE